MVKRRERVHAFQARKKFQQGALSEGQEVCAPRGRTSPGEDGGQLPEQARDTPLRPGLGDGAGAAPTCWTVGLEACSQGLSDVVGSS